MSEKKKKSVFINSRLVLIGVGLCVAVWVLDPFIDALFFREGHFFQQLFRPEFIEIYFRSLVSIIIIVFSVLAQSKFNKSRKAEEVLDETKRYLDSLISSSTDAIIATNGDGRVTFFSSGAENMLGWEQKDILDQYVVELYESEEKAKETMRLMRLNGGTVSGHETNLRTNDGGLVPVLISASILHDEKGEEAGTVGFSKDITEHKLVERKIKEQSEFLESILSSVTHPLYVIDVEDYSIKMANPAAKAMYGDESGGATCHALTHKLDEPCGGSGHPCPIEEVKKTKKHVIIEHVHFDREGNTRNFEVHGYPIVDDDGKVVQMIEYSIDITERKRLEQELRQADKLAAIGRLTAGATHEILNPLNAIKMVLHMSIRDSNVPEDVAEDLKDAEIQVARINKITSDLLHFSRQNKPERKLVDVNRLVEDTLSFLAHDLKFQNIDKILNLDAEVPGVLVDKDQLQQVVLNLLTNACDAMPDGGKLTLSTKLVFNDDQEYAELRIGDTGSGISPRDRDMLFEPFFTTKPIGKGTGLGLSICRGIVESHGGQILAENDPKGGAVFVVRLPLEEK